MVPPFQTFAYRQRSYLRLLRLMLRLCDSDSRCYAGTVEYLPKWLAPNLITLIGIAGLVAAYLTTLYHLPGLAGTLFCSLVVDLQE